MISFVEPNAPWLVRPFAQLPLGPLYLATVLENKGYDVNFVRLWSKSEIPKIRDSDIIAFSGTTLEHHVVLEYAKEVRAMYPDKVLWYGGPHATALPNRTSLEIWDSVGVGEAEGYIVDMAEDSLSGSPKPFYESDTYIDINSLPNPDRTLVTGSHGSTIFAFGKNYKGVGNENVLTSRGCPYNCAFCSSQCMWGRGARFRDPKNIIDEIRQIDEQFGQKQIRFADDSFTSRPIDDLAEVCEELGKRGCAWRCSVRADSLTDEVCEIISDGGCKEVSLGIESADQRVLDFLGKKANVGDMIEGAKTATDYNMTVRALMMIGTPGEHPYTPELNRDFIQQDFIDCVTLSTFIPLPGSPIWLDPDKYNCEIIDRDFSKYNRDFWVKRDGEKKKSKSNLLIRNLSLTHTQQHDNIRRMEQYVLETEKGNQG